MQNTLVLYGLIGITVWVSYLAFKDTALINKLQFSPYRIFRYKEYSRFITYGFVHADWMHLLVNMFVLFSFGRAIFLFGAYYFKYPVLFFVLLYAGGLFFSTIYTFINRRSDYNYAAVGASGAVSTVVFASILFFPTSSIRLFFIPIDIPAYLFGILYLFYSVYMSKKANDNIGHDVHFFGALFGFIFPLLFEPRLFILFISQILG